MNRKCRSRMRKLNMQQIIKKLQKQKNVVKEKEILNEEIEYAAEYKDIEEAEV